MQVFRKPASYLASEPLSRKASKSTPAIALFAVVTFLLGACSSSTSPSGPVTLTYWAEATLETFYKPLVEAWNAGHPNKVQLTLITKQEFIPRVAAAASGGSLPDVISTDLIYMPDFIDQGLFQPVTDKLNAYPKKADLAQAYIQIATAPNGKIYGAPNYVDASSLFWNKDLFKKAGLDPEKGPTSWAEVASDAAKIRALGGDTYGFYFAGACAGCNAYTFLPQIWAAGGDVINYKTHTATMTTDPAVKGAFQYYADMWKAGVIPPSAKSEAGATWSDAFARGNIGIEPGGAFFIPAIKSKNPSMNFGVTGLPGNSPGSYSAFAGGAISAITKSSKNFDAAWQFLEWAFSDDAQLEVYAKNGYFTSRLDLSDNKYSHSNPPLVANNKLLAKAQVPNTLGYNEIFNDINGPWLASITQGILGGDIDGGLRNGQAAIQKILDSHYK